MPRYAPASAEALTLALGQWTSAEGPSLNATLEVDPRIFAWLVNKAARRASGVYTVNQGTPPLALTVEED